LKIKKKEDFVFIYGLDVRTINNFSWMKEHKRKYKIKNELYRFPYNNYAMNIEEFEKLNLEIGTEFHSTYQTFETAFEFYFFGKNIENFDKDVVVPALIKKEKIDLRGVNKNIILSWIRNTKEKVEGKYCEKYGIYLDANEYYDYLNTLLPQHIRISHIDIDDPKITSRFDKLCCGYFYLEHPNGDHCGALLLEQIGFIITFIS